MGHRDLTLTADALDALRAHRWPGAARGKLIEALAHQGGNRARAAQRLGISRAGLYRLLDEYGLHGVQARNRSISHPGRPTAACGVRSS